MKENVLNFLEFLEFQKNYSKHTIKNYNNDIEIFLKFLNFKNISNFSSVTYEIVREFLKHLHNLKYTSKSICRIISALRSLFKYLCSNKIIDDNPMLLISNPKVEKKLPKYLEYDEAERLLNAPNLNTLIGIRDYLVLELLYSTGIRVSELVNIKISDIDFKNKEIKILGKGNKERIVLFGEVLKDKFKLYFSKINLGNKEYLLINQHGNKINDREIRKIVDNNMKIAGINKKISPHTLRHTFATHMLNSGADIKTVGDLLGHETISTTTIYTHISNEKLRNVYLNTHPRAMKK